jgi:hypothetical protein
MIKEQKETETGGMVRQLMYLPDMPLTVVI